jgi:hypothetical protein
MEDHQHLTCDFPKIEDWTGPMNQKPWAKKNEDEQGEFQMVQRSRGGPRTRRSERSTRFRGRR